MPPEKKKSYRKNPIYVYLLLLTLCTAGGLQVWRTLFNNFAVDIAFLDGSQIGVIQGVREMPGFLCLLVVYVLLVIREQHLAWLSVVIMGVGIAATGLFPNYGGLITTTLVMSFGFHYFETVNQSLTLQYFSKEETPTIFALMRSRAAACNAILGIFFLIVAQYFSYRVIYLFFGCLIIAIALYAFQFVPSPATNTVQQRKGMILKKRYWLFYTLTFLAGARRQIFIAFALFLLVKKFSFSVQEIAVLVLFNSIIGYLCNPLIGKAVVRFGERWVLSIEYFLLIFIFIGYGFTET